MVYNGGVKVKRMEMNYMSASLAAIQEIINTPQKKYSKEQATKILIRCGIMSKDGKVQPAYKTILVSGGSNGTKK